MHILKGPTKLGIQFRSQIQVIIKASSTTFALLNDQNKTRTILTIRRLSGALAKAWLSRPGIGVNLVLVNQDSTGSSSNTTRSKLQSLQSL